MNESIFDEINRIAESLTFEDISYKNIQFIQLFKNNMLYMKNNFISMGPEEQIMKMINILEVIENLTNPEKGVFEDSEDSNRKKLLQIYFLLKTRACR